MRATRYLSICRSRTENTLERTGSAGKAEWVCGNQDGTGGTSSSLTKGSSTTVRSRPLADATEPVMKGC
jgi:hypothetical protein